MMRRLKWLSFELGSLLAPIASKVLPRVATRRGQNSKVLCVDMINFRLLSLTKWGLVQTSWHCSLEVRRAVVFGSPLGSYHTGDTVSDHHGCDNPNLQQNGPSGVLTTLSVVVLMSRTEIERHEADSSILVRVASMFILEAEEAPYSSSHEFEAHCDC